jgi:trehalose 6-phosphate synthase/phosphatase
MAQDFSKEGADFAESPRPITSGSSESVHPGLRPSLTKVPVTPGIHLGEYASDASGDSPSYFTHDISKLRQTMAQSPSDAASGAKSNLEILRRMSLTGGLQRKDSLNEIDPRAANPSLGLSGGIISATFCIPHSLQYRKGADWVGTHLAHSQLPITEHTLGIKFTSWNLCPLRFLHIPLLR